jgi:hypothetical protein
LLATLDDETTLVGGSVVSIYTDGRYVSNDLDFVTWRQERQYKPLMEGLGFRKRGSYWEHDDTELLVQFVSSPVMVGSKMARGPWTPARSEAYRSPRRPERRGRRGDRRGRARGGRRDRRPGGHSGEELPDRGAPGIVGLSAARSSASSPAPPLPRRIQTLGMN